MSTPKARVGAGTPAGGEFKAVANGEATTTLAPRSAPIVDDRGEVETLMREAHSRAGGSWAHEESFQNRSRAYLLAVTARLANPHAATVILEVESDFSGPGLSFLSAKDSAGVRGDDLDDGEMDDIASGLMEGRQSEFPASITPVEGNAGVYELNVDKALADRPRTADLPKWREPEMPSANTYAGGKQLPPDYNQDESEYTDGE